MEKTSKYHPEIVTSTLISIIPYYVHVCVYIYVLTHTYLLSSFNKILYQAQVFPLGSNYSLFEKTGTLIPQGTILRHLAKYPRNHGGLFCLRQESRCTTGSEPNVRGTQASAEVVDSLSENQEHGDGDQVREASRRLPAGSGGGALTRVSLGGQRPAVRGGAVLAVVLPGRGAARAAAGPGAVQGVPAAVPGLRDGAQPGFRPGKPLSFSLFLFYHICVRKNWLVWHYFLVLKRIVMNFHFSLWKSGRVVSTAGPPGRWELGTWGQADTPQGHWPGQAAASVSQGTRLLAEDAWVTLAAGWPRPAGCVE